MDTQETALARRGEVAPAVSDRFRFIPQTLGEAKELAVIITGSEMCPKAYKGKINEALVAYEFGCSLGMSWMQALRSIAVINGTPSIWGDAVPALIMGSRECERFHEFFEGEFPQDTFKAVCIIKRKGMADEVRREFSIAESKLAGLWGKTGQFGPTPWVTYPKRMLQMRARGFAARDAFADKLSGLILAEEAQDYPNAIEGTVVAAETSETSPVLQTFQSLPEAVQDRIEKGFAALNMSEGQRLALLGQHLAEFEGTVDDAAQRLLDWLKDEYAKRKTGQPVKRGGNGKDVKKAEDAKPAEAAETGAGSVPADQGGSVPKHAEGTPASDRSTVQPVDDPAAVDF